MIVRKTLHCPCCAAEVRVDMDLSGITDGEMYHQSEDCDECNQPFVVSVRARYEWGCGTIEWQEPE